VEPQGAGTRRFRDFRRRGILIANIGHDNRRPVARETRCERFADPAAGAGDDRNPAFEPAH
jgi:hypothetical protein